jgi:hypothetical protein
MAWTPSAPPKWEPDKRGLVLWRPLAAVQADDPEADYLYAFGRFVHEFGKLELVILVGLRDFAGMNDRKGRLLLSNNSAARCVQVFKDMAVERSVGKKEIEALFAQYSLIKTMRDQCVHRTADRQPDGKYAAHNEATSKRDEDNEYFEFTLDDLRNASIDLNGIAARLMEIVYPRSPNGFPVYPVSVPPWKYKQINLIKPHARKKA